MENTFENIIKSKMEGLGKNPPVHLQNQLNQKLADYNAAKGGRQKAVGGSFIFLLLLLIVVAIYYSIKQDAIKLKAIEETALRVVLNSPDDIKNQRFIEARQKAAKENKLIFINVYNEDCAHCQEMEEITFSSEEVKAFLRQHFIRIDINVKEKENPELRRFYNIKIVPTFLFVNKDGKLISKMRGNAEPSVFIEMLEKAMELEAGISNHYHDEHHGGHSLITTLGTPKDIELPKYQETLRQAKATQKLIFLHLYNEDCLPCKKRKDRTLSDEQVKEFLENNYLILEFDIKKKDNEDLLRLYDLYKTTALLLLDGNGMPLITSSAFPPPNRFLQHLKEALKLKEIIVEPERFKNKDSSQSSPTLLEANIFPNPSSGKFSIKILGEALPVKLRLINSKGQVFWSTSFDRFNGEEIFQYDLTPQKGVFYVQIIQRKEILIKEIILQ